MPEKNPRLTGLEKVVLLVTVLFAAGMLLWFYCTGRPQAELTLAVVETAGQREPSEAGVDAPGMLEGEVLDLNTASEGDLSRLPGIGTKRAADIVTWREEHGGFQSVEDIMEVSGIGPGIFERIQPYITVTPAGETGGDHGTDLGG